ncbi:mediator of DNA damage checkpoint protein 1 [Hetaerina americana]|uniref:mediator of DNA damage checkpoint protein 1 n=1 Tax=Hetaerina americana TaxID=62018 RepID=UPI003A7F60AF
MGPKEENAFNIAGPEEWLEDLMLETGKQEEERGESELHSEYRSTYRWHEYTGPRQEVIRRPPQPVTASAGSGGGGIGSSGAGGVSGVGSSQTPPLHPPTSKSLHQLSRDQHASVHGADDEAPTSSAQRQELDGLLLEPALPRKKKHPELAYKTHEFLAMSDGGSDDSLDSSAGLERARRRVNGALFSLQPEERANGRRARLTRRSKSEGPPARHLLFQSEYRLRYWKCEPPVCYGVVGGGEWVGGEEGAGVVRRGAAPPPSLPEEQRKPRTDKWEDEMMTASYPPAAPGHPTRISTEYRLQFAWPRAAEVMAAAAAAVTAAPPTKGGAKRGVAVETVVDGGGSGPPRKSLSMGAIRPASHLLMAPVHKKRADRVEDEGASELEPLVGPDSEAGGENMPGDELRGEEKIQLEEALSKEDKFRRRKEYKTEYKKKFRPFSQYEYVEGRFQKKKDGTENIGTSCGVIGPSPVVEPVPPLIPAAMSTEGSISSHILPLQDGEGSSWYREVLELRRKAGEYKHRGWGTELVPQHIAQLYNKQMALWEQVSRRSSLSALSLASTTPRPISKEEKEKENNKKSSPVKGITSMASTITPMGAFDPEIEKKKMDKSEEKKDFPRSRKEYLIRHHLERTTGAIDGALLPSPTREKLEPILPRRKEEDVSIKSPPRASPKSSPRSARSHSVGPAAESRSPKRHPRVGSQGSQSSTSPAQVSSHPSIANSHHPALGPKAPSSAIPSQVERRPRPTSLTTHTSHTRPKSSSVPLRNEESKPHHAMKPKTIPAKSVNGVQTTKLKGDRSKNQEKKDTIMDIADSQETKALEKDDTAVAAPPDGGEPAKPPDSAPEANEEPPSTAPPAAEQLSQINGEGSWEEEVPSNHLDEPLVKSPPEPTRVKSPEQILMRSPEPVNWTVPLDTGKTFTVTQNVLEAMPNVKLYRGELSRPHSEAKVWTPPGPSSLPGDFPTTKEQARVVPCDSPAQVDEMPGWKSPVSEPIASTAAPNLKSVNGHEEMNEHDAATPEKVEDKRTPKLMQTSEAENDFPQSSLPLSDTAQEKSLTAECEKVTVGTTLKSLDDPSLGSEAQPPVEPVLEGGVSSVACLEAPQVPADAQPAADEPSSTPTQPATMPAASQGHPVASSMPASEAGPSAGPYRILEAPECQESPMKALPPLVSPSSGRSLASDVLEKARTRFDKFWGKGKDSEGKV